MEDYQNGLVYITSNNDGAPLPPSQPSGAPGERGFMIAQHSTGSGAPTAFDLDYEFEIGCSSAGDQGPQGPQGPAGDDGGIPSSNRKSEVGESTTG